MKKFVKGSLIAAGGLAALGCILCLISGLIGGKGLWYWVRNDRNIVEKLEKVEDKLDDIADIDMNLGTWHLLWRDNDIIVGNGENGDLVVSEDKYSVLADEIKNLELILGAGKFIVQEKEVSDGVIDIHMKGIGKCSQYIKDDTLYVEGFKGLKVLGSDAAANLITLEIPAGMNFDEIHVEVGAGVMEISSINANEIDVEIGAGELSMEDIDVKEFSAEIGAGRLDSENVTTKDTEILVGMGECVFRGIIQENLDAECDMGNMEFHLEGEEKDYNYDIECSAGNISVGSLAFTALAAERKIDNGAIGTFDISCSMGNVVIDFEK